MTCGAIRINWQHHGNNAEGNCETKGYCMQTKPKSNSVVTTQLLPDGRLEFTVLKGSADGLASVTFTFDPAKASEANRQRAMVGGFNQRIVNMAALPRDTKTGRSASPADKAAAMRKMVEHLESGTVDWSPAREATAGGARLDPIILAAVVEVLGLTTAQVRERVAKGAEKNGCTQAAYLEGLTQNRKVAEAVARIKKNAPKPELDADAELDAMMAGDDDGDDMPQGEPPF